MKLASATIFKDEFESLQRMVDSLDGKVDLTVLLQTGVGEGTIGCPMPSDLGFFEWTDHFGDAKNAAVVRAEANGANWIIVIDSDEELVEDEPGALRRACLGAPSYGLGIELHNVGPDGQVNHTATQWRILKCGEGIRYHGRIHEQLRHPDHPTAHLHVAGGVHLVHHGYRDTHLLTGEKRRRNHRLLLKSIHERADDEAMWFQLGAQLLMDGTAKRAIPCLERAIDIWRTKGADPALLHVRPMFYRLAEAYHRAGAHSKVIEVYATAPNAALCGELLFYAGMSSLCLGRTADAAHWLQLVPTIAVNETDVHRFGWRIGLAGVYTTAGNHQQALDILRETYQLPGQNRNPQVVLGLAQTHYQLGNIVLARSWAQQLIDGPFPASWQDKARKLIDEITQNGLAPAGAAT